MQGLQKPSIEPEKHFDSSRRRHDLELKNFWIRGRGASLGFRKVELLAELSAADQFFAAILRDDIEKLRELLQANSWRACYRQFFPLIDETQFGNIISDKIAAPKLGAALLEGMINSEGGNVDRASRWISILKRRLRKRSRRELINNVKATDLFRQILTALSEKSCEPIWLKGVALSHSVYSRPQLRSYSDFDCYVPRAFFTEMVQIMQTQLQYRVINRRAGFCMQYCVGPVSEPYQLLLSPSSELVCSDVAALTRGPHLLIDLKLNPLNSGLLMAELERFNCEAQVCTLQDKVFRVPSPMDSLLIGIVNFTDNNRFQGWRSLYDIHLLLCMLSKDMPGSWAQLIDRCRSECITLQAWAALTIAVDRFHSPVPEDVLESIRPRNVLWQSLLAFTANPEFVWNANSLPMLLLSVFVYGGIRRKLAAIASAFFPTKEFLRDYYAGTKLDYWFLGPVRLLAHWLILFLPGGAVRRLFGRQLWVVVAPKVI